jgi:hypothetical protein
VFNPAATSDDLLGQALGFSVQKLASLIQAVHPPGDPVQVECVGFVEASLGLVNIKMPVTEAWASQYWRAYASQPGWQEIPNGSGLPQPGDIMLWYGDGTHAGAPPLPQGAGHMAIVVAVNPPSAGQPGSVVVAQGHAPGNITTPNSAAPNAPPGLELYSMPLSANGYVSTWPGWTVMGVLRDLKAQNILQSTLLAMGSGSCPSFPDVPGSQAAYVQLACSDAMKYGISPAIFARQIHQESGFNPNAISSAGAEGIAQFEPGTAASWGVSNPWDPVQALDGAAKMMSFYVHQYLTGTSSAQSQLIAYVKALVAYNAGPGATSLVGTTGLPAQTKQYINIILVPVVSQADQQFILSLIGL